MKKLELAARVDHFEAIRFGFGGGKFCQEFARSNTDREGKSGLFSDLSPESVCQRIGTFP
jgi:hypothetical protein